MGLEASTFCLCWFVKTNLDSIEDLRKSAHLGTFAKRKYLWSYFHGSLISQVYWNGKTRSLDIFILYKYKKIIEKQETVEQISSQLMSHKMQTYKLTCNSSLLMFPENINTLQYAM